MTAKKVGLRKNRINKYLDNIIFFKQKKTRCGTFIRLVTSCLQVFYCDSFLSLSSISFPETIRRIELLYIEVNCKFSLFMAKEKEKKKSLLVL